MTDGNWCYGVKPVNDSSLTLDLLQAVNAVAVQPCGWKCDETDEDCLRNGVTIGTVTEKMRVLVWCGVVGPSPKQQCNEKVNFD